MTFKSMRRAAIAGAVMAIAFAAPARAQTGILNICGTPLAHAQANSEIPVNDTMNFLGGALALIDTIAMANADVNLTEPDACSYATYKLTGANSAIRSFIFPSLALPGPIRLFSVLNATTGGYAVLVTTGTGSIVSVPPGFEMLLRSDGANILPVAGRAGRTGTPGAPTSCGSGPSLGAGSTDEGGTVTAGSGSVTACTITFAQTWPWTPNCTVSAGGASPVAADISAVSTTAFTAAFASSIGGSSFRFNCR